jgi:hypothetical protein
MSERRSRGNDDESVSDADQTSSRNLSPKEMRFEVISGQFSGFFRFYSCPKVPTNIFLGLNL